MNRATTWERRPQHLAHRPANMRTTDRARSMNWASTRTQLDRTGQERPHELERRPQDVSTTPTPGFWTWATTYRPIHRLDLRRTATTFAIFSPDRPESRPQAFIGHTFGQPATARPNTSSAITTPARKSATGFRERRHRISTADRNQPKFGYADSPATRRPTPPRRQHRPGGGDYTRRRRPGGARPGDERRHQDRADHHRASQEAHRPAPALWFTNQRTPAPPDQSEELASVATRSSRSNPCAAGPPQRFADLPPSGAHLGQPYRSPCRDRHHFDRETRGRFIPSGRFKLQRSN